MSVFRQARKLMRALSLSLFLFSQLDALEAQPAKPKLADYKLDIYSQNGEDGIVQKIFDIIGAQSKLCIEFGAWDGFHLSNTANLWVNQDWRAILIESDPVRFNQLVNNVKKYVCLPINQKVGIGSQSLEAILKTYSVNEPVDLLSIDIDSDDYYIFESLNELRPRVVICEHNSTMPAHLDIYPEYGKNYMGCSVGALVRIGKEKGYSLIAITDGNSFFVRDDEFEKFANFETSLEKIRIDRYLKYAITNYAGDYALIGVEGAVTPFPFRVPLQEKILGPVKQFK